jgi:hypothetical protein
MDWSPRRATLGIALAGLASCFGAGAANAALVQGSFSVEVVALDPGITTVVLGDRFDIDFTVDDAATDDEISSGGGHFPGLLTSFVLTADPGNTGSWAPSGTFDLGAASNFVTNAIGDGYTFQVRGTGFPDGGPGLPFFDIDLNFTWPGDITDSGIGDSFADQFGGAFDPSQAVLDGGGIRFQSGPIDFPTAMFVPEPSRPLLLAVGLFVMGAVSSISRRSFNRRIYV